MVFDSLFGQTQASANLLVGESKADQTHQLLLSPAQSKPGLLGGLERESEIPRRALKQ
jgi:hypothetical protein